MRCLCQRESLIHVNSAMSRFAELPLNAADETLSTKVQKQDLMSRTLKATANSYVTSTSTLLKITLILLQLTFTFYYPTDLLSRTFNSAANSFVTSTSRVSSLTPLLLLLLLLTSDFFFQTGLTWKTLNSAFVTSTLCVSSFMLAPMLLWLLLMSDCFSPTDQTPRTLNFVTSTSSLRTVMLLLLLISDPCISMVFATSNLILCTIFNFTIFKGSYNPLSKIALVFTTILYLSHFLYGTTDSTLTNDRSSARGYSLLLRNPDTASGWFFLNILFNSNFASLNIALLLHKKWNILQILPLTNTFAKTTVISMSPATILQTLVVICLAKTAKCFTRLLIIRSSSISCFYTCLHSLSMSLSLGTTTKNLKIFMLSHF
jgi:hypothetical protein